MKNNSACAQEEFDSLQSWAAVAVLSGAEVDCITAVMLKILDGKCKMPDHEKVIMETVYDVCKHRQGKHLGDRYHRLIVEARTNSSEELLEAVYETRVLAETQISRPVMKTFKARLRKEGVLPPKQPSKQLAGELDD